MKLRQSIRYLRKGLETWEIIAGLQGWRESFKTRRPVDGQGRPIPWYTFPAIEFLCSLELGGCRVFEFGCGNSSVFWASRARQVHAVENDLDWARIVRGFGIGNLTLIEATDRDEYVQAPRTAGGNFDVIVIDGRHRVACVAVALECIAEGGMIILDNADWYPQACADLAAAGWFQIDFSGLGPINSYSWTTAVFLRTRTQFQRRPGAQPIGGNPQQASA
jgi:hypothetical protein